MTPERLAKNLVEDLTTEVVVELVDAIENYPDLILDAISERFYKEIRITSYESRQLLLQFDRLLDTVKHGAS